MKDLSLALLAIVGAYGVVFLLVFPVLIRAMRWLEGRWPRGRYPNWLDRWMGW